MGISWADVGAFGEGLTKGVGRGMDLYSQYSEIQTEKDLQQRKKAAEQASAELFKSGQFDQDPVGATKQLTQIWASNGFMDEAVRFDEMASKRREVMAKEAALRAWQLSDISLDASVQAIGDYTKALGKGDQIQLTTGSDGRRQLVATIDGQQFVTDIADLDQYKGMLGQYLGPTLMGTAEYFKAVPERDLTVAQTGLAGAQTDLTGAQTGKVGAETRTIEATRPGEVALLGGKTAAAYADAAASRANAAYTGVRAQWYGREAEADIAYKQAGTAKLQADADELTKLTGMAGWDAPTVLELVQANQPTDTFGQPDPAYDPIGRAGVTYGVAKAVIAAGGAIDLANAAAAANVLASPTDVTAAALLPNGMVVLQSRVYGTVPITQEGLGALNAMRLERGQQPIMPAQQPAQPQIPAEPGTEP